VSSLTALTTLNLSFCNVSDEVLRALSGLTALSTLDLRFCRNVTAAAKQALRTAIPNLTIYG
jgi:Leucine-rich repeat (LRR) protein